MPMKVFLERFNWGKENPRWMWAAPCPPWPGVLDWTQRRRWARHQHQSFSASFLWMPRDRIPHVPVALTSPAKLNLTPLSSICWAACHSNGKKRKKGPPCFQPRYSFLPHGRHTHNCGLAASSWRLFQPTDQQAIMAYPSVNAGFHRNTTQTWAVSANAPHSSCST